MIITKDNLMIRSATLEDAEILTAWWNDGNIMAHAGFPLGLNQSIEKTTEQIKANESSLSQRCIIEVNHIKVGEMNYWLYQDEKVASIGIKICNSDYQNKGYGTKFIKMLIEFIFTDEYLNGKCKINKIILDTNVKNKRAQHVYEKIGFSNLGINKKGWLDQLGIEQHCVDFAMTRAYFENSFIK